MIFCVLISFNEGNADAQSGMKGIVNVPLEKFFPRSLAGSMFEDRFKEAVEVKEETAKEEAGAKVDKPASESVTFDPKKSGVEFNTRNISEKTFLPPDQTPSVAVNPESPSSVIQMIESSRRGDTVTAKGYARQFVRVLQNYFFEVRQITSMIGEALIEENAIQKEDWVGAEQSIDIEMARTRLEKGVAIKPNNDVAMKRIVPDPKKEVQVFYLFSRSCSYCRYMAPDVERLNRAIKGDKRVKITGLVVGGGDEAWLNEFRDYTGLSMPVFDETEFAEMFKLKFFPVILVLLPNGQRSYFKSGQQTFESMFEFVRTAQGLPINDSASLQALVKTPIGEAEKLILTSSSKDESIYKVQYGSRKVRLPGTKSSGVQVEKF
jgi:thiol-disulfide isomerase/thioredoxin